MEKKDGSSIHQYLTFTLDEQRYAINVRYIKEVLYVPPITKIPRMPSFITGVVNLRGKILSIIDLKQTLGLGKTILTDDTSIVVTEIPDFFPDETPATLEMGFFSDSVEQVREIPVENIEPLPVLGMSINSTIVQGMGRVEEDYMLILKPERIFSEKDLTNFGGALWTEQ